MGLIPPPHLSQYCPRDAFEGFSVCLVLPVRSSFLDGFGFGFPDISFPNIFEMGKKMFGDMSPFSGPLQMSVISVDNATAGLNCSWTGESAANLTWVVSDDKSSSSSSGMTVTPLDDKATEIQLDWAKMNQQPGSLVFVTCNGVSGGSAKNGTSAWTNLNYASQSTTITVPE